MMCLASLTYLEKRFLICIVSERSPTTCSGSAATTASTPCLRAPTPSPGACLLDEKTVLFDTVDRAVQTQFFENLEYALNGRKLDYVFVHHMEPDHAATLGDLMIRHPEATIVCNGKSLNMIRQFHATDPKGAKLVNEGDTITTGRHAFTFVNAPMVHWPEVMVSYDSTDKILFSADAFGTFGALNGVLFADEVNFDRDWLDEAPLTGTGWTRPAGTTPTSWASTAPRSRPC